MKTLRSPSRRCGFSLVELLGVLAAIAAISAIGVVTVTNTKQAAEATKLDQDVASINESIEIYRSNGGDLSQLTGSDSTTIDAILAKLKSKGESSRVLGVTSAVLDARVQADYGDNTSRRRARWDSSKHQFVVADAVTSGVVEFTFDEALASDAAASETGRSTTKDLATSGGWVWDHSPATDLASTDGNTPGTAPGGGRPPPPPQDNLTGGISIVDPNGNGEVVTDNKYYDGAGYQGELGIFSLEGMGNPPYDLATAEGLLDFMREAVRRVVAGNALGLGGIALEKDGTGHTVNFTPGSAVAFILIPDSTFAGSKTFLAGSNPSKTSTKYPLTSLSFDTGDVGGFSQSQAVSLQHNVYAIEDIPGGGDRDYEDVVWKTTGIIDPEWSSTLVVDPSTYYSNWDNPTTSAIEHINRLGWTGNDRLLDGSNPTLLEALQNAGALDSNGNVPNP